MARRNLHIVKREPVDLYETLARAGYKHTLRDDLAAFVADLKHDPWFACVVFGLGMVTGMAATVGLAELLVLTGVVR